MLTTKKKLSASGAIKQLMEVRGYVVVGFPAHITGVVEKGDVLFNFCGFPTVGGHLKVTRKTTLGDWQSQVEILFGDSSADRNTHEKGERFFRCVFVKVDGVI